MKSYISTKKDFLTTDSLKIVDVLKNLYPSAEAEQIQSWKTLIDDVKTSESFKKLNDNLMIAIEYSLPTDNMAIDLVIFGKGNDNKNVAFIVESKQWNDEYINSHKFSAYREEGSDLHPQIQITKHKLSFQQYLSIGSDFDVFPYVFIRNCSSNGIIKLKSLNPKFNTSNVPILNKINSIFDEILSKNLSLGLEVEYLENAEYCPSIGIMNAMKSIVSKEEPFILTSEQMEAYLKVKKSIKDGKKLIRIKGAAGSGKTAILLNLYVDLLDEIHDKGKGDKTMIRPYFISGNQNTYLYRSLYPDVQNSFSFSYSVNKMIPKSRELSKLYIILMDEAQHNEEGLVTELLDKGCTLVLCYDENQTINANNSISELKELEKREDFISIELHDSVRFNGSKVAEKNIISYLTSNTKPDKDDLYDLKIFDDFDKFQNAIIELMKDNNDYTVAVAGLICTNASDYTIGGKYENSKLFTKWGNKGECDWIPYVKNKKYLDENEGNIWVGTWWMPGLDFDYIAVIVGGDAKMTKEGLMPDLKYAQHFNMIISIANKLKLPNELHVTKNSFGKIVEDKKNTSKNIIAYLEKNENKELLKTFNEEFRKFLIHNYYITMSRGRKGCYIYFANQEGS